MALEPSRAAEPGSPTMDTVIVTATRSAKPVDETPGASFVVTRSEMDARNLQSIDDSLNLLPGVFQKRTKGVMDTTNYLVLRGVPNTNYNRTIILFDGVSINDGYTTGVTMGGFAPQDLERVEVSLGPASSLYGSSAMGGVVNYITRMPRAAEFRFDVGFGGPLGSDHAGRNLRRGYVSLGNAWDNGLSLVVSAAGSSTDGYVSNLVTNSTTAAGATGAVPTNTTSGGNAYIIGDQGDNSWRDEYFSLRGAFKVSGGTSLDAAYTRTGYHYGYSNPSTYQGTAAGKPVWSFGSVTESNFVGGSGRKAQDIYRAGLTTRVGDSQLRLAAGMVDVGTNWYVSVPSGSTTATLAGGAAAGAYSQTPSRTSQLDATVTTPFGAHLLVWGANWNGQKADTSTHDLANWTSTDTRGAPIDQSGGRITNTGAYAQADFRLGDIHVIPGLRYDAWRSSDGYSIKAGSFSTSFAGRSASAISPKLGATWALSPDVLLRASVGRAFRAPSVYELYRTWRSSTGTTFASNADLRPETMTGMDLGGDFKLWRGAELKATIYRNSFRDMIYRQTLTDAAQALATCGQALNASKTNCQLWINAGRASSKGFELGLRQSLPGGWSAFGSIALNSNEIQDNAASAASVGKRFVQVPARTASLGVAWQQGEWSAGATARYASKRFSSDANTDVVSAVPSSYDAYTLVDLKVGYRLNRNLRAALAIDNLLNRDYYAFYRAPGRSVFASLSGSF